MPFFPEDIIKRIDYIFNWISSKPYKFIIIGGNHENYDYWESCPIVDIYGGKARQAITNKGTYPIYFVDFPTIFTIDNKRILCIPKAESHDIWNLLDPKNPNFKKEKKRLNKNHEWYRVIGESWWPQEKMNVQEFDNFINKHADEHFDYICSHDAPGSINSWYKRGRFRVNSTEGQEYLESLRQKLDFDIWIHGHFHFEGQWHEVYDSRMIGLYKYAISEQEIKDSI